jgi:hypothetical protein
MIKAFDGFIRRLRQGWLWLSRKLGLSAELVEVRYKVRRVDDEPQSVEEGFVYVVEDAGLAWAAVMSCPGGCGQLLHMNLIPDSEPVWHLTEHADQTATLVPSVWRKESCGCHFLLKEGQVLWCK